MRWVALKYSVMRLPAICGYGAYRETFGLKLYTLPSLTISRPTNLESRTTELETEWSLDSTIFDNMNFLFGPFDVDLFARRINRKLPSFVSWKKDAMAWTIDAFFDSVVKYLFISVSSLKINSAVLLKIDMKEADYVIIIPLWKS